jgi:Outer membrane protein beta-barrel domain
MKRAGLAVVTLAALTGSASAGTYLGLGIGTSPAVSEQTDRLESGSRSGKLLLGTRFGNVAVEGSLGGFDMLIADQAGTLKTFGSTYQAAIAGKLSVPLGNNFEAFGRAGIHHTWIDTDVDANAVSGNGLLLGAGIEYRLNLIVGQGSIFMDYQYSRATLEGTDKFVGNKAFDSSYRMWTLGLTVGL